MNPVHALTKARIFASLLQWGIDRFAKQTRSASPRLGQKVARFTAADEVLPCVYCQKNLISLCSHQDTHPNLNREVRHSLTWYSSESESALERFEPVAAAMLWSDGQGTLFALVAARRQKVFKRGILSSFCPFRSFRTSEKNSERVES